MAMMVQGSDGIMDEALPVADLAASLRLPDGYEAVPGQLKRLRSRLRAAIAMVEERTGKILLVQTFRLGGTAQGGLREVFPVVPLETVVSAQIGHAGNTQDLAVVGIEPHPHRPTVVFSRSVQQGAYLEFVVTAGFSNWEQVPAPLREATLVVAQGLDTGEDTIGTAEALMAPYRPVRISGGVR